MSCDARGPPRARHEVGTSEEGVARLQPLAVEGASQSIPDYSGFGQEEVVPETTDGG
jgi:hypothetical protein